MKHKTYRIGVFETNSSSSHTLILSNYPIEDQYRCKTLNPTLYDGVIHLTGGEFGWSWERFTTAYVKANYIAVYAAMLGDIDIWNRLRDVIIEETGATDVINDVNLNWSSDNYSYIDHQSYDNLDVDIVNDKEKLRSFIFDVRSILVTGNDNEFAPCGIKDPAGTVYKYKLEIPSLINKGYEKMAWYFVNEPTKDELNKVLNRLLSEYWYDKNGDVVDYWDGNYSVVSEYRFRNMPEYKDLEISNLNALLNLYTLYKTYISDGKWNSDIDDVIFMPFTIEKGTYELYK